MKLFETLVERTLAKSPLLHKAVDAMTEVAVSFGELKVEVHNLGVAVMALAHTVQAHHVALQELYARQGLVMKAIKSNSLNMDMPGPKTKEPAKPN